MTYEKKYQELVGLSHSDNPEIREKAEAWLVSIGLQDAAELKVSAFLLNLAVRNVKGEITREEVSQRLRERYGDNLHDEPQNRLDGGYEILPSDSPKIEEIEEYNRKLRPALYAELDKKRNKKFEMKALTYTAPGRFELIEKPKPEVLEPRDALVRVTLSSICSSDLHILHGAVPQAGVGITVGHELVGVVEAVGSEVSKVKPSDRVAVNVETFCGECFYCKRGYVNNCTSGGWMLGCRIDGGQAEYVRVPYADNGLTPIPDNVSDEQALFVGDILATGYWAAKISEIFEDDTVLIIGAGPTGLCTLECVQLYQPHKIVVCESDKSRRHFVRRHYPNVKVLEPKKCLDFLKSITDGRGADRVIEDAGSKDTFELAWRCARPNAIVTIVALYEKEQILPLPWMYGKNLTFKTGGVDACDCDKIMQLISEGRIDTTHLITHRYPLSRIQEAYDLFASRADNVIKTAIYPD